MGLFDMFKKKKVEQKSNLPENKYYKGNDIFKDDEIKGNEISIRIIKSIEIPGHSNLYECTVQYGIPSTLITDAWENEDLRFFEKLIIVTSFRVYRIKMHNYTHYTIYFFATI